MINRGISTVLSTGGIVFIYQGLTPKSLPALTTVNPSLLPAGRITQAEFVAAINLIATALSPVADLARSYELCLKGTASFQRLSEVRSSPFRSAVVSEVCSIGLCSLRAGVGLPASRGFVTDDHRNDVPASWPPRVFSFSLAPLSLLTLVRFVVRRARMRRARLQRSRYG